MDSTFHVYLSRLRKLVPGRVSLTDAGAECVAHFIDACVSPEIAFEVILERIFLVIDSECAFAPDGSIEGVVFELPAADSRFNRTEWLILGPDDLEKASPS